MKRMTRTFARAGAIAASGAAAFIVWFMLTGDKDAVTIAIFCALCAASCGLAGAFAQLLEPPDA